MKNLKSKFLGIFLALGVVSSFSVVANAEIKTYELKSSFDGSSSNSKEIKAAEGLYSFIVASKLNEEGIIGPGLFSQLITDITGANSSLGFMGTDYIDVDTENKEVMKQIGALNKALKKQYNNIKLTKEDLKFYKDYAIKLANESLEKSKEEEALYKNFKECFNGKEFNNKKAVELMFKYYLNKIEKAKKEFSNKGETTSNQIKALEYISSEVKKLMKDEEKQKVYGEEILKSFCGGSLEELNKKIKNFERISWDESIAKKIDIIKNIKLEDVEKVAKGFKFSKELKDVTSKNAEKFVEEVNSSKFSSDFKDILNLAKEKFGKISFEGIF